MCACALARACVHACMRVRVCARVHICAWNSLKGQDLALYKYFQLLLLLGVRVEGGEPLLSKDSLQSTMSMNIKKRERERERE